MKSFRLLVACFLFSIATSALGDAAAEYKARCAVCHDSPADLKTPNREAMGSLGMPRIRSAMLVGAMSIHAQGLSREQVQQLAEYLNTVETSGVEAGNECANKAISSEVLVSHWGMDTHNTRHQPDSEITSESVGNLKLRYVFGIPQASQMRSWPAVSADTIFLPSFTGKLYAIDRTTGCVKWTYSTPNQLRTSAHLVNTPEGLVVAVGDSRSLMHAINAETGELLWTQRLGLSPYNMNTGSPVYFGEEWFVPVSAFEIAVAMNPRHECCKSHGLVTRVSRKGSQLWTAHMTAEPKETYKNALGVQMFGPSGAPVWTTPAIDEKRGLLYVGTGENTSSPATDKSDAIVAIDLKSGAIKYHFQGYLGDAFNMACGSRRPENCPKEEGPDFDFGASPIIVTTPQGKDIVLAGQKSGDVWALDPDDSLKLLWQNKLSNGSVLGGVHWGMTVVDNLLIVPIADPPRTTDSKPGVYAIEITTGKLVWEYRIERGCEIDFRRGFRGERWPECPYHFAFSAAASSTNDVVFSGSLNGTVFAFNAKNGDVLWSYDTKQEYPDTINGVPAHGGAVDNPGVIVAGNQVIVLSGYGMFGQMPGNAMLVFEI